MTDKPPVIGDMDDYSKAADYLIGKSLTFPDGFMLRAVKTLMDEVTRLQDRGYMSRKEFNQWLIEKDAFTMELDGKVRLLRMGK